MRLVRLRARQRARQDGLTWPGRRPGRGRRRPGSCRCASAPGARRAYRAAGADPAKLAAQVRAAADGAAPLPGDAAAVLGQTREAASAQLLADVLAAVRAAAPGRPVLVHSAPDPRAVGANPGYDPAVLCGPGGADGIVLACGNPASAAGPGRPHRGRGAARRPDRRRPAGRGRAWAATRPPCPPRPRRCAPPAPPSCASTTPAWPRRATSPRSGRSARTAPSAVRIQPLARGWILTALASRAGRRGGGPAGTAARRRCARRNGACSSRRCCRVPRIGSRCIWCTTPCRPRWPAFGTDSHGAAVPPP